MLRYLSFFLFAISAVAADQGLTLQQLPVLPVDANGSASATLTLQNNGKEPILQLHLKVSDFTHKRLDGKVYHVGASPTLASVNEKDRPILDGTAALAAGATLAVKVAVTNLSEAQSEAVLKNGDNDIPVLGGPLRTVLKAVRIPVAYNLQIVSATPDAPEIHVVGDRALVGFKNLDTFNYRFTWKLRLNDQLYDGGKQNVIELVPGDVTWANISSSQFPTASTCGILTAGTLKDETERGSLILDRVFEDDAVLQPLTSKDLPVSVRMSYWSGNWQVFWNGFFTLVLLVLGGIVSIWLRYGIPNYAGGLALKRRILERKAKIEGMGPEIDSRWRVLLESHLSAIRQDLSSSQWVFPSFATLLVTLNTKIEMVHQWVEIAYSVATTLHRASELNQGIPPTVFQRIQEGCSRALTPIESGFTTPDEITAMKAHLKAAQNDLDLTVAQAANPELEQQISLREKRLTASLLQDLTTKYPQFGGVISRVGAAVSAPLSPLDYVVRDITSLKVDLLRVFDDRVKQLTVAVPGPVADALTRHKAHQDVLMTYLVPDTNDSLSMARIFVDEMRQDIYPDGKMREELTKATPAMVVVTAPSVVEARKPVRIALRFDRDILNGAAARQEWTCTWEFGDNTPRETGWEVFHTYNSPGSYAVNITVRDRDANALLPRPLPNQIRVQGPSPQERSLVARETKLEAGRLAIVLAIAFLGLMTTARHQVQSLTFFEAVGAVVVLGFGANALKDLVSQRPLGS